MNMLGSSLSHKQIEKLKFKMEQNKSTELSGYFSHNTYHKNCPNMQKKRLNAFALFAVFSLLYFFEHSERLWDHLGRVQGWQSVCWGVLGIPWKPFFCDFKSFPFPILGFCCFLLYSSFAFGFIGEDVGARGLNNFQILDVHTYKNDMFMKLFHIFLIFFEIIL